MASTLSGNNLHTVADNSELLICVYHRRRRYWRLGGWKISDHAHFRSNRAHFWTIDAIYCD